jgi:hypothetical protein
MLRTRKYNLQVFQWIRNQSQILGFLSKKNFWGDKKLEIVLSLSANLTPNVRETTQQNEKRFFFFFNLTEAYSSVCIVYRPRLPVHNFLRKCEGAAEEETVQLRRLLLQVWLQEQALLLQEGGTFLLRPLQVPAQQVRQQVPAS